MDVFGKITLTNEQLAELHTPCYIVNESRIEENLKILDSIQQQAGCTIILALKGFAMWSLFPMVKQYLPGVTASSVNEALLGRHEFGGKVHVYAPVYSDKNFETILSIADHITFNSIGQWKHFKTKVFQSQRSVKCAVRINPEHSEVTTSIYDPCAPFSRLGITLENFKKDLDDLNGISGLHFHTLCELNSDALERTLKVVKEKFGFYFPSIQWINCGGGHHITRSDYDRERLVAVIKAFKARHKLDVILEPGEAIALNTGVLIATVLDIFDNGKQVAMLDTSAAAHMPDVLEMPYRPFIQGAGIPNEKPYTYRLGGTTCLAGDVIGDYSFDQPLKIGQKLVFGDMAHYSMVKNNTFNGVNLPSIYIFNSDTGKLRLVKDFGYEDYKNRLS